MFHCQTRLSFFNVYTSVLFLHSRSQQANREGSKPKERPFRTAGSGEEEKEEEQGLGWREIFRSRWGWPLKARQGTRPRPESGNDGLS